MKKIYSLLFIFSFIYILLLTIGIPFYWQDYTNLYLLSGAWEQNSLTVGFEFAFRPLGNFIYFLFFHSFGLITVPFRLLKALATAGVVLGIYFFVEKNTGQKKIAMFAALFYLTASAVLQSVMLIYDFEIIVQFLLLLGVYFFFKAYEAEKPEWKNVVLFIVIITLAILTKESAKVFVGVLCLFVLLLNGKKLKYFIVPSLILLFLAAKPEIIFGLEIPYSASLVDFILSEYSIGNFILFIKYLVLSTFGVLVVLSILSLLYIKDKKMSLFNSFSAFKERIRVKETQLLLFFCLWFFVTALLTAVVPMVDKRYAIVPLLPFTIASSMCIGRMYKGIMWRKWVSLLIIIFISVTIVFNIGMALKYRYGFGNFFILLDEAYTFTETNYRNSILFYTDSIAHFHNFFTLPTNNEYFEYHYFNESKSQNKTVFFYALVGKLQIKERNKAALETTFLKGPQCFMLYTLQEREITEIKLEEDEEQQFVYNFREETPLDYCSIEIETRFLIPQEVEITIIGENENVTTTINPPLGKYKSCEYLCHSLGNVTKVEVKVEQSFFSGLLNKIYSAKLRVIEK